MLDLIHFAWAWLALQNALAPYSVVTLVVFGFVYAWRKLHPKSWLWLESRLPFALELNKVEELAKNVTLALPSIVIGAALAALSGGASFWVLFFGGLAGACAPLLHHVRKALPFDPYKGALPPVKDEEEKLPKPPRVPFITVLALLALLGCGPRGAVRVPCDASDHQAQLELAAKAADCRARVLACKSDPNDVEGCKQAVYDECDAWGAKRCAEAAQ